MDLKLSLAEKSGLRSCLHNRERACFALKRRYSWLFLDHTLLDSRYSIRASLVNLLPHVRKEPLNLPSNFKLPLSLLKIT